MGGILGVLLLIALVFIAINVVQWGFGILIAVIFWGIAGYLASRLTGGDGAGLLGNVLLGVIGGAVGSLVLNLLGISGIRDIWLVGSIIAGVIGAVIVIYIARALGMKDFAR